MDSCIIFDKTLFASMIKTTKTRRSKIYINIKDSMLWFEITHEFGYYWLTTSHKRVDLSVCKRCETKYDIIGRMEHKYIFEMDEPYEMDFSCEESSFILEDEYCTIELEIPGHVISSTKL